MSATENCAFCWRAGSVEFSFSAFLQPLLVGSVKQFSSTSFIENCNGQDLSMKVSYAVVIEWFEFEIWRLIDQIDVDTTLAFVPVPRLCEIGSYALGLHGWLSFDFKTGNLFLVNAFDPMICMLTDSTVERVAGTESVGLVYQEVFSTRRLLFVFAKAA